jgi:hypothetical protein
VTLAHIGHHAEALVFVPAFLAVGWALFRSRLRDRTYLQEERR